MAREEERRHIEQESSALGTAVNVGAVVGAGAAGWRYRRQIGSGLRSAGEFGSTLTMSGVSRLAGSAKLKSKMQDVSMFARALNHAADGRGVVSHLQNSGRFNSRFEESVQQSMKARMGGEPLQALTDFQDMRNSIKAAKQQVFETHRMHNIVQSLAKNKDMKKELDGGLEGALKSLDQSWFYRITKDKVSGFTDMLQDSSNGLAYKPKFESDAARQKFENSLFENIKMYEDRKSVGWQGGTKDKANPVTEALRNAEKKVVSGIREGFIDAHKDIDDLVSRSMKNQGFHRATFEDLMAHSKGQNLLRHESRDMKRPMADGRIVDARMHSKISKMTKVDPRYNDLVADKHLWVNDKGEFLDARWMAKGAVDFADGFRQSTQVPFLRFNPLDLMHFTTWDGMRKAPKNVFKKMGTIDPGLHGSVEELKHPLAHNQDAAVGILSRGYVNTADGKVYDLLTGDIAKTDVYQASGRFGMMPRAMASMANLHTKDYTRTGIRGKLGAFFDVGKQETESVFSRMASTVTKFDNQEWGPNVLNGLKKWKDEQRAGVPIEQRTGISPESAYKLTYSQLESKSTLLSDDTANYINSRIKESYGDINIDLTKLNTEEEIMSALGRLNQAIVTPSSGAARTSTNMDDSLEGIDKLIHNTWQKYAKNPTQFMNNQRILPNNAPYLPEWLSALDFSETDLVKKADDVKRLIQQHASRQLEYTTNASGKVTVADLVKEGIESGALHKDSLQEVRHLESLTQMRQYWDDVYKNPLAKDETLDKFAARALDEADPLSSSLQLAMNELNPKWSMGPGQEPPQYFGFVSTLSMNKAKGVQWGIENHNQKIAEGMSPVAALMDSVSGVLSQPFAGRSNTGNVTTATLPFYYLAERLDNAIAQAGLGLSQKNRGSMQSILANQFGRRIVAPYVAYEQAVWLDGMFGDVVSDKAAETYANMHEDTGHVKEFLGLNDIGRQWSRVFSGGDQLAETPIGRAFNFATFGLFDHKSGEEVRDWYESGEVAVRKGRYWGIGSNTPYTGGHIDRYVPNWYRRIKSDYKFTDTMYGSESEYYANHWMPTLTNPLAPVRHFFLDPYHWEKKHEETRPYPMTGGYSSIDQIPLIGPAINNTVGRVFKPRREHPDLEKAHRAYMEEINANISAQYAQAGEGGAMMGMPAGGFNVVQGAPGGGGGISPEEYDMMLGSATGAAGEARGRLAAINSMYSEIGGPSLGATGKNVRSLTALEDLRDPDVLANLADIGTMHSVSGTIRDSFYSTSEMAGIYGFLFKSGIGFEESGRGMTLDQSSRMTSYARAWWDLELGGMGGQLSEIGRRYVPRDPNKNYWNPIKNKMPEWLPGPEYFTDFKHGDPYVKIANGEMRLPGEAYEKLYKLHPDALGEYGAFDRFRILADVAPYSENYKFYRGMVSKMNQAGMLTDDMKDEYAEIRDQVSSRKQKHRFYNRRFDNADVQYETVTITRMLDATTFLTKEHPNNPIRMAGVKVKADDEETMNWLQQYVHEGAKVRIAVDADPLFRVRDDTYNTMRAVVYANKTLEGEGFLYSNKGQNVNFMLANRKTGGILGTGVGGEYSASVHDDGSATATAALFSKDMITVGKMWEGLTHDILPSLPIVGTIADKFLQVRSPLEMYKRNEVYGKAWRPWTQPIEGWIKPMLENMAAQNPVVAAAQGAGVGWLFAKPGRPKYFGTRIGAVVGGGMATARVFLEQGNKLNPNTDEETWLPQRRRTEREINEYFDKLKYVKYKGLYERARREALRKENVDIEELIGEHEERGAENKARRNTLQSMKKWLSMNKKLGYGDEEATREQLDRVRSDLKEIDADRPNQLLGKYSMLALRYRAEYESTLYGADEHGDMTKIFRALPSKDREFFTEFMKAAPKEREEILRLVPKDQRRFYQAKWGLKVDKKESLDKYFNEHYLPDENWEGWRADTSLENYKVKVVQKAGLELTEFGMWGDDVERAEQSNAKALKINQSLSSRLDIMRLEKALKGAGLSDVNVSVSTSPGQGENKVTLAMDILKDRSSEIVTEINHNLGGLFS